MPNSQRLTHERKIVESTLCACTGGKYTLTNRKFVGYATYFPWVHRRLHFNHNGYCGFLYPFPWQFLSASMLISMRLVHNGT